MAATLSASLLFYALQLVSACNYIKWHRGDINGTTVIGRDMQFDLGETFFAETWTTFPVGRKFRTLSPVLDPYRWEAQFGILGMVFAYDPSTNIGNELLEELAVISDGTNTEGLQCAALYLDGTEYQKPDLTSGRVHLENVFFCSWVLSQFSSVLEVNKSLPEIVVTDASNIVAGKALKNFPPLHWAVTDRAGASIIVEYVQGRLHVYDNVFGVMTNSPPYDWQLTNLRRVAPSVLRNDLDYREVDLAMQGLPADPSPTSRFVRLAVQLHLAQQRSLIRTTKDAVTMMQHLLNVGEVVRGVESSEFLGIKDLEVSLWSVVWDLQALRCWFRSYDSQTWSVLDMQKLDFTQGAAPMVYSPYATVEPPDVTALMKKLHVGGSSGVDELQVGDADAIIAV